MIHVLTGANDYLRVNRRHQLTNEFIKQYGDLTYEKLDGEEVEMNQISGSLESLPFLAAKKLVVILSPGQNKDFLEKFKTLLENLPETTELIIDEPKFDKRSSYYKFAKKLDGYEQFDPLDQRELAGWLIERAKTKQAVIDRSAAQELVARVGTNQQYLDNELTKLGLYSDKITVKDVQELTQRTPSSTIFELIEAAFSGDKRRALELYDEQRALQVDPIQIVAMFTWQFHVLALVVTAKGMNSGEIAREAKLNPYVVQKTERLTRNLSLKDVKTHISRLREIDGRMKSAPINADDALKAFIISL